MGELGFAQRIRIINNDRISSERWFDAEGNPMTLGDTYCRVDYTYDTRGNINREKYYDESGQPILCSEGYAIVYRELDVYNRIVYEKFYGTDGFAVTLADGTVSRRYEYDEEGNLIRVTRYDLMDRPLE